MDVKSIVGQLDPETVKAFLREGKKNKIKKLTTSKVLIYLASVFFVVTWGIAIYSWFTSTPFPIELVQYVSVFYGLAQCAYYCKSAYENKAKIECAAKYGDSQGEG